MSNVWWQLLLAFGYGLLGSLIPVINGEAFVVAAIATHLIGPVEAGICLGLGQGVGKMILFQVVRHSFRSSGRPSGCRCCIASCCRVPSPNREPGATAGLV